MDAHFLKKFMENFPDLLKFLEKHDSRTPVFQFLAGRLVGIGFLMPKNIPPPPPHQKKNCAISQCKVFARLLLFMSPVVRAWGRGGWRVACSVGFGVKIHLHVPVWLKGALSGYGEKN